MAPLIPYTYIQCPCSDEQHDNPDADILDRDDDYDERTFDPRAPRSTYSLFPVEYLMYCEDCQQIRCPRCVSEEIVTYYCSNCLFEVPSSNVRSEGNRCTRSCYQCPICVGPLQVGSMSAAQDPNLLSAEAPTTESFALFCHYCNWSSGDIGIRFDRPSGIHGQLSKMKNGGDAKISFRELKEHRKEAPEDGPLPDSDLDADLQYNSLKAFYESQLSEVGSNNIGLSQYDGLGFQSPSSVSRIMSMYTVRGHSSRGQQNSTDVIREALSTDEGLRLAQLDESAAIKKLSMGVWEQTASLEQHLQQAEPLHFHDELRPVPYLLRTKRSKRCPICRHIISRPESKVSSTRFKIRLVAQSYVPTLTIKPLHPTAPAVPVGSRPSHPVEESLKPFKACHYIVTFKNPLFEKVKITLAAPNATPGRFSSNVTVLCPQFEVDANTDMWDEALREDKADPRRRDEESNGQPEAGKIWERGRNWVSIILEVVPASLRQEHLELKSKPEEVVDKSPLREDEDLLEIPLFVRVEWEADAQHEVGTAPGKDKEARETRELAYWCVLGVGRISQE